MIDALETYPAWKGTPASTRQLRSSDRVAPNRGNHRASQDRFPKNAERTVGSDLTEACTEPSLLYRALPTAPTSGCVSRKARKMVERPWRDLRVAVQEVHESASRLRDGQIVRVCVAAISGVDEQPHLREALPNHFGAAVRGRVVHDEHFERAIGTARCRLRPGTAKEARGCCTRG